MSGWNSTGGRRGGKLGPARSQEFSGIMFESHPKAGWEGHWTSVNGRVILRHRRKNDPWDVLIDGKKVGTPERVLGDVVSFNDWAIRPASLT